MDDLLLGLLYLLMGLGACAGVWLFAEGVERFADWADGMFTKYDL